MWLCGLYYGAFRVESCLAHYSRVFFFFVFFFSPVKHCDHLGLGRESWSMCISCICLFILHVLISVHFLFLLVSGNGYGL